MAKHPIDSAILKSLDQLSNLMGEATARKYIASVVKESLARVLNGTASPGEKIAKMGKGKAKKAPASGSGGGRGPKPGGRQLKALIGPKDFDALDPAVKDKARLAIAKMGAKWGALSTEEKNKIISPILGTD